MPDKNTTEANNQIAPEINPANPLPQDFEVLIVNIDKIMLETRAKSITIPVPYGNLAILPGHTPLFTKLVKGNIEVFESGGKKSNFEIENGVAKLTQFKVTILVGF